MRAAIWEEEEKEICTIKCVQINNLNEGNRAKVKKKKNFFLYKYMKLYNCRYLRLDFLSATLFSLSLTLAHSLALIYRLSLFSLCSLHCKCVW